MDKCRICLSSKRNLRSIFESTSDGNSFVAMMKTLANVIIVKNDGSPQKICQICCSKLVAAYNFKTQIERSEEVLQNSVSLKKICFSNLQDIKNEILDSKEIIPKCENQIDDYFKDGESCTFYNNTVIKKIETVEVTKKEPLSVIDYLNNFTADSDQDDDDGVDFATPQSDNEDHEYMLPLTERKKKTKKMKLRSCTAAANTDYVQHSDNEDPDYFPIRHEKIKKKAKNGNNSSDNIKKRNKPRKRGELRKVLIKPVILNDIQVLRTKEKENTSKDKKKYYRPGKLDMCTYCGKMTRSLKTHLLTHTGKRQYKCDLCTKSFYTGIDLNKHKKTHSLGKTFKCDQCVAAFISKGSLNSHLIMHSEEKRHMCDICNKCFKRRLTRDRHKRMHNLANKCIKCELCNMSFFTRDNLKHHMRIHTGERPYKCELCSQPYSYKHDFNRHCFKKHGIFLKRRLVNVMNEEVLNRERALMKDLMMKINSAGIEDELLNRFEGPRSALAFEMAIKALKAKQINVDY